MARRHGPQPPRCVAVRVWSRVGHRIQLGKAMASCIAKFKPFEALWRFSASAGSYRFDSDCQRSAQAADYTGPLFDAHLHYNEEAWNGTRRPPPARRRARAHAGQRGAGHRRQFAAQRGSLALAGHAQIAQEAGITVGAFRARCTATGADYTSWSATNPFTTWCWTELERGDPSRAVPRHW